MALRDRQEKSAHDRSSPTPSGLPGTRASAEDSSSAGRQRLPPLSSLLSPHVGKGPETSSKAAESSPTSVPTLKEDKSTWSPERRDPRIANSPSASEARLMDRQKRFRSDSDERSTTGQGSASGIAAGRAYPAASSSAQYGAPSERWGDRPQAFPSSQQRIYGEPFNARPAGQELPPLNSLNILSPNSNVRTSPRGAPTYAQQRRSPLLSQEADRERQARAFLAPARHHSLSVSSHPEATSPEARQASASISSQGSSISRGPFARSSAAPAFSATREPARRRWSDNLSRDRGDSTSSRDDIFARIWDLFAYAKQQNDEFEVAQASGSSLTIPPMPAIDRGDVASVSAYLRRELELLHRRDPQLAIHIADDEAALLEQQRMAQLSPDSAESYEESRFGPHRTSRQGVYASGRGMGQLDHRRPPPFGRAASHYDQGSHLPPYAHRGGVASSPYGYPGQDVPSFRHRSSDPSERYRADFRFYDRGQPRYSHHDEEMLSHSQHNMQAGINSMPRRVRKRRDEAEQSCLSCSATETPEWRKGPTGPRTLCNACGLLFAKQCRKREFDAQARGERPKGGRALAPEDMTPEEKERSLVELQLAVHARTGQAPMAPAGMAVPSMTGLPGHR